MIVFLTVDGFQSVLKSLTGTGYGVPLPEIRVECYEDMLRRSTLPRATYVFSDLERLSGFELRFAGALYMALAAAGMRVLNNPARVTLRYELLRTLAAEGINPFTAYRADDAPRPQRFPVFIRSEAFHLRPGLKLLHSQDELDAEIESLKRAGEPANGLLVIECVPSDRIEGRWHKWGAFCVNGTPILDHVGVDTSWMVKTGDWAQLTPGIIELEHAAVLENRYADFVANAFRLARTDFGRADFALAGGRPVLFEINTNPVIHDLVPDPHLLRRDTMQTARRAFAAALFAIDSKPGSDIAIRPNSILGYCHRTSPGTMLAPKI